MARNISNDIKQLRKFDLDLEFGVHWEEHIDDLFKGVKTCEVKTEKDKWRRTGNICIELESWGKPSGINSTTSDIWVHNLTYNNKHIASILLPTDVLKDALSILPKRTVYGGDSNASKLQLVDLVKLIETLKGMEV